MPRVRNFRARGPQPKQSASRDFWLGSVLKFQAAWGAQPRARRRLAQRVRRRQPAPAAPKGFSRPPGEKRSLLGPRVLLRSSNTWGRVRPQGPREDWLETAKRVPRLQSDRAPRERVAAGEAGGAPLEITPFGHVSPVGSHGS